MVAEVFAGLAGFKTMLDTARSLKDMNDAVVRNAAVIQLQEQILAAQQLHAASVQRVRDLESEVAQFKTWETEKQRYKLKDFGQNTFAYELKPRWQTVSRHTSSVRSVMKLAGSPSFSLKALMFISVKVTAAIAVRPYFTLVL